jgi:anaerobic selenocysteine-containing dehydrogenase
MQESISRRNFLKGTAAGAGALAVGIGAGSLISSPGKAHAALTLPSAELDVEEVRRLAWKWYHTSGCG